MTSTFIGGRAPGALPLAGHALPLIRRPVDFLASLREYGDLVEVRLGPTRAYVPCHPELVRRILADDRTFDKGGPFYRKARDLFGNSIGTCPQSEHRRQRRLLQPAFHRHRIAYYASVMQEEIEELTRSWSNGERIDAYATMNRLTLRTVIRTLFSAHADEETVEGVRHAFETLSAGFFQWMFFPDALHRLPLPAYRRHRRSMTYVRGTVQRIVENYRRDGVDHGDLLSMLIAAGDPGDDGAGGAQDGPGLSDEEIEAQILTMLAGGSETVATTLTWALYLLSEHPDIARAVRAEADDVLKGRPAGWDDLPALVVTERVVRETLRVRTPAWLFTRATTVPVDLGGVRLPEGAPILICPPAVHLNADVFPDPERFDPDRWLPEARSAMPKGSFQAFSAGARKCIGDVYGLTESVIGLATIAGRWDTTPAPGADLRLTPLMALNIPRRLHFDLTRRGPVPDHVPTAGSAR
ncbi:cytochrome P450 [Streptomyces sp. NPDC059477]|uniref:cytochrome P450 n=1 Tax=Streptomyces sp. NPDC059477 TaxID=3346847 RepID=UPI00369F3C6D